MASITTARLPLAAASVAALAVIAAGCGSSSSKPATSNTAAAATTPAPTQRQLPRLHVLFPRAGAHVSRTFTVRVRVSGAAHDPLALRYVLDRHRPHRGSARFTFRGLAPGRHHLTVALVGNPAVRVSTNFTVRAPVQAAPATAPAPAPATTSATPAPTTTAAPPPPPGTTTAPPPPPPTTTTPSAGGGIPQGPNAGDGDADNHGGPTDGDGNI